VPVYRVGLFGAGEQNFGTLSFPDVTSGCGWSRDLSTGSTGESQAPSFNFKW